MPSRPFLVVRARVHPDALDDFRRWYLGVQVPHVLAVPGIVGYRGLRFGPQASSDLPNVLSAFVFADEEVVRTALASPEAQRAREDWGRWSTQVRDLAIQVYTTLDAQATLHHLS